MKHVIIIGANGRFAIETIPRLQAQEDVKLTLFLRQANRVQDIVINTIGNRFRRYNGNFGKSDDRNKGQANY
ncbi:hypothetical protein [Oceanobacillus sp. CFH 90083]|uniref:hypothetical protein n=1 Tax=Oceanobacillus sp. CFH 90083 TaxID=2592336 RepID=UPI00351A690F